ncbi:COX15/CtaA family protein [Shumkonia mesophila]|uniref:COX15/CtaA family protein n=1 Tax=Shumkonia mesophila TaxID=2838854 RepID=UPI0029344601|nr:COX15/CtaA family protein [Shumkonia mesophila]
MEHLDAGRSARQRTVAYWLLAMCVMVYVMVLIGGFTRLTYAGLSIVEWKPLTGWLPPLTLEQWEAAFADYRRFPEYREVNAGMSLDDFRTIFLIEYFHRLWGRVIGVAFLVPFVFFFARGWVDKRLLPKLLVMFVLGGLQGALGWYMVKSGLIDEPDVSAYRLTAHLALAVAILGYMLWVAMGLLVPAAGGAASAATIRRRRVAWGMVGLVFTTILSGGLVAGNNAGFAYNTFPTMDGEWIPEELFALQPLWINFFEDVTTLQFDHRLLALATVAGILAFWAWARRAGLSWRARLAIDILAMTVLIQAALGISTLLLVVPLPLALLHQAGAVALFSATLWAAFEMRRDPAGN